MSKLIPNNPVTKPVRRSFHNYFLIGILIVLLSACNNRDTAENKIHDQLQVVGLLENPDNIYSVNQIEAIHWKLLDIAKQQNYTLDYSKMRNWSHGYYFYEYHNK